MTNKTALDPENRALYGEILRAPAGYELDQALATTYTLDFETALVIPATLAFHAAESRQQTLDTPLALLEGLERLAKRIAIFCEAGRIKAMPSGANRLTALLEDTVTEVIAPRGGAFHPKLWALRFKPVTRKGPARLRIALLSRNLTTDTSWDLSLCLDGQLGQSTNTANDPLIALLLALPNLAPGRKTPRRASQIAQSLAADLATAIWEHPEHIRKISFAVNGLSERVWHPRIGNTLGVISPFVTDAALMKLGHKVSPEDAYLLGRGEELAKLKSDTLQTFGNVMILDELAETEDGDETEDQGRSVVPSRGLHAKAFLTERYSSTEITLGSGNATTAALINGSNVEVFATLSGYTRDLGTVQQQLSEGRLGRYLCEFSPYELPDSDKEDAAEKQLDGVRRQLAEAGLKLSCYEDNEGRIELSLSAKVLVELSDGIKLHVWPLVTGQKNGTILSTITKKPKLIGRAALKDVTRWLGVELQDAATGFKTVFTLGTDLIDLPETRTAEILRSIIENQDAFLNYLRLLLGDVSDAAKALFAAGSGGTFSGIFGSMQDAPLLEDMVKALSGDGRQLHDIERLIERLTDPETGKSDVISEDFLTLWETFRTVLPKERSRRD